MDLSIDAIASLLGYPPTKEQKWELLLTTYDNSVPQFLALDLWGAPVVKARFIADCPECIKAVCAYHESQRCADCGGAQL